MLKELVAKDLNPYDIKELDHEHLWEKFFLGLCGIDFESPYFYHEKILPRERLEDRLDEILDYFHKFEKLVENPILRPKPPDYGSWVADMDDIYIGYQVLGLLILQVGARLPFEVYDAILYSTTWEYDKTRGWAQFYAEKRKKNLEVFRNLIIMHKSNEK